MPDYSHNTSIPVSPINIVVSNKSAMVDFPNPQWRAPEEQVYSEKESDENPPLVTEKVDVYGLGNILYRLLVGKGPWKRPGQTRLNAIEKDQVAHLKRENGTLPYIPSEVQNSNNPFIVRMREAMYQCYRFNPEQRPSAREIVAFLQRPEKESNLPSS